MTIYKAKTSIEIILPIKCALYIVTSEDLSLITKTGYKFSQSGFISLVVNLN